MYSIKSYNKGCPASRMQTRVENISTKGEASDIAKSLSIEEPGKIFAVYSGTRRIFSYIDSSRFN